MSTYDRGCEGEDADVSSSLRVNGRTLPFFSLPFLSFFLVDCVLTGWAARYRTYRATVRLVAHHYRPHDGTDELDARRELSHALNELAAV